MGARLNVLVVEDDQDDAALMIRELATAGFEAKWERVESAAALRTALPMLPWDLCIADYSLPSFGAPEALEIVRALRPHLPFIVVSGTIGEERAVALMRAGADDYFLKGNLARLGASVQRAVGRAAELGRSESRLEAIMAGVLEGVVASGSDGMIAFFNAGAERIFGHAAAEVLGTPVGRLFPERLREQQSRLFEFDGIAARTDDHGPLLGLRATGEEFPIEATISKVELGGEFVATVVLRDITGRLSAAAELRASEARLQSLEVQQVVLEEAARAKSTFIASMNHELRTPLNAILGFSMLLMEQLDVSTKQRGYLEHIYDAGGHLLALISNLLDMAKLEAGKMELRPEPIGLAGLLEPALSATQLAADAKGLRFTSSSPDGVTLFVDPVRIREVLHNLLSNAMKFTPTGGEVALRVQTESGGQLVIEVSDTGAGIPPKDHGRVFGSFERFHEGVVDAAGTGLGLSFTKQLVELHGGTITFDSAPGIGSTFRVRLPGTVTPAADVLIAMADNGIEASSASGPMRNLVLANEAKVVEVLRANLASARIDLIGVAASVDEAVRLRDAQGAALVVKRP